MLRFILYDDNEHILKRSKQIINKIMMPYDIDYRINSFTDYNKHLDKIISDTKEQKIYLLDIELPSISGIDLAIKIREKDWNSVIIILTAHGECKNEVLNSRLMLLDYISKFNNFEKRLEDSLNIAVKVLNGKRILVYRYNHITYRLSYDEICYVIKDGVEKKCIIVTDNGKKFLIGSSLKEMLEKLKPFFIQTHKSCIINLNKIKEINASSNEIILKNGKTLNFLSRTYKTKLEEKLKM